MPADQADGLILLEQARDRAKRLLDRLRGDAENLRLNTRIDPAVAQRGGVVLNVAIESAEQLLKSAERAIESAGSRGEE